MTCFAIVVVFSLLTESNFTTLSYKLPMALSVFLIVSGSKRRPLVSLLHTNCGIPLVLYTQLYSLFSRLHCPAFLHFGPCMRGNFEFTTPRMYARYMIPENVFSLSKLQGLPDDVNQFKEFMHVMNESNTSTSLNCTGNI